MDTLLFIKYEDDPELNLRIDLNIYGIKNGTNFWRTMNSYSVSTAGYTEGQMSTYIEVNTGDQVFETFLLMLYYDENSIIRFIPVSSSAPTSKILVQSSPILIRPALLNSINDDQVRYSMSFS